MADYKLKYTGNKIDSILDAVASIVDTTISSGTILIYIDGHIYASTNSTIPLYAAGDLYVHRTNNNAGERVATEAYVDNAIANIPLAEDWEFGGN